MKAGTAPRTPAGAAWVSMLALATATSVGAAATAPRLHPGAIELGLAGSLVSVAGSTRSTLAVRAGRFFGAGGELAGWELEAQFHHQRALDQVELQGSFSWQRPVADGAAHPFIAVGGGVRQETIGSFAQARYPLGFTLGLRLMTGARAAVRTEYRFRRLLGDPVADFSEHQWLTGISLLLRNRAAATDGVAPP